MKTDIEKIVQQLVTIADNKKAENIKVYHVSEKIWITDYIMIITASNEIHLKALLGDLEKEFKIIISEEDEDYFNPIKTSGKSESGWVILDLNSIIVHLVDEQTRDHYKIDELFESNGVTFHY